MTRGCDNPYVCRVVRYGDVHDPPSVSERKIYRYCLLSLLQEVEGAEGRLQGGEMPYVGRVVRYGEEHEPSSVSEL